MLSPTQTTRHTRLTQPYIGRYGTIISVTETKDGRFGIVNISPPPFPKGDKRGILKNKLATDVTHLLIPIEKDTKVGDTIRISLRKDLSSETVQNYVLFGTKKRLED